MKRLEIAAMAMQGLLASGKYTAFDIAASDALGFTDALIKLERETMCERCDGEGQVPVGGYDMGTCKSCNGTGVDWESKK